MIDLAMDLVLKELDVERPDLAQVRVEVTGTAPVGSAQLGRFSRREADEAKVRFGRAVTMHKTANEHASRVREVGPGRMLGPELPGIDPVWLNGGIHGDALASGTLNTHLG
jgi:hypothetical protein